MGKEIVADPTFPLFITQSSRVRSLAMSEGGLAFDYHNEVITATWPVDRNHMEMLKRYAVAERGFR